MCVAGIIAPWMLVVSGHEPFTWVMEHILASSWRLLLIAGWFAAVVLAVLALELDWLLTSKVRAPVHGARKQIFLETLRHACHAAAQYHFAQSVPRAGCYDVCPRHPPRASLHVPGIHRGNQPVCAGRVHPRMQHMALDGAASGGCRETLVAGSPRSYISPGLVNITLPIYFLGTLK